MGLIGGFTTFSTFVWESFTMTQAGGFSRAILPMDRRDRFLSMRRFFRYLLLGYAWLFLVAIVAQVYFAGLMLFGQEGGNDLHLGTGYVLSMAGLLFLALPALARAGARTVVLGVVLSVITFFQPTITFAREESPVIAALHPVNALLIFAISVLMIVRATQLVREERAAARSTAPHESRTTT